jgi:hypothetical protein
MAAAAALSSAAGLCGPGPGAAMCLRRARTPWRPDTPAAAREQIFARRGGPCSPLAVAVVRLPATARAFARLPSGSLSCAPRYLTWSHLYGEVGFSGWVVGVATG